MRKVLLGFSLALLTIQVFAAQLQLKAVAHCELAGPKNAIELLRGSPLVDYYVYKIRHTQKNRFIFDTLDASRGASVQWQCVSNQPNMNVLMVSGEFTSNYLQGALFYFDQKTGQIERVDFAERNRPRWVQMSEQGARVIFENTGNESSHKYLVYGKGDTYLELDELPQESDENGGPLIELKGPQP
ncbi:hypothetical protein [Pseudomonas brassicacearum]|uniref:Uncharacterized protein n=1 Tax=Pseudomonas brassicacearum TaxID=930166 RepID=A0A423GXM3_9PSED|nr:hypothetical protein [Pseudomonas brassicacearum]RON02611.1 hypothetical protein BK658_07040 [Pseudomonas brassicacearum]